MGAWSKSHRRVLTFLLKRRSVKWHFLLPALFSDCLISFSIQVQIFKECGLKHFSFSMWSTSWASTNNDKRVRHPQPFHLMHSCPVSHWALWQGDTVKIYPSERNSTLLPSLEDNRSFWCPAASRPPGALGKNRVQCPWPSIRVQLFPVLPPEGEKKHFWLNKTKTSTEGNRHTIPRLKSSDKYTYLNFLSDHRSTHAISRDSILYSVMAWTIRKLLF